MRALAAVVAPSVLSQMEEIRDFFMRRSWLVSPMLTPEERDQLKARALVLSSRRRSHLMTFIAGYRFAKDGCFDDATRFFEAGLNMSEDI